MVVVCQAVAIVLMHSGGSSGGAHSCDKDGLV